MEAAFSSTARYLRNSLTPDDVDKYLDSIKAVIPRVVWDIECFHYRTVQRVQYSSKNGNGRNIHTDTEKIVTHRASDEYSFDRYVLLSLDNEGMFQIAILVWLECACSHNRSEKF